MSTAIYHLYYVSANSTVVVTDNRISSASHELLESTANIDVAKHRSENVYAKKIYRNASVFTLFEDESLYRRYKMNTRTSRHLARKKKRVVTQEFRDRVSRAQSGRFSWSFGKKNLSYHKTLATKRRNNSFAGWPKGVPRTEENRKRNSESHKGLHKGWRWCWSPSEMKERKVQPGKELPEGYVWGRSPNSLDGTHFKKSR